MGATVQAMDKGDVVQGRYRIERELGSGGMGTVYLAVDLELEREIALKVTAAAGRGKDEFRARFEREAAIGCALGQEPGFVRAFDWGELPDKRTLYMAMDLVRGGQALDLKRGSLLERLRRLEAAAERVARIHSLGVVHRDLKPTNFLVDEQGVTWLLDFGLAKIRGESGEGGFTEAAVDLTRTGVGMGTPAFMPPEQFEDAKAVDPRGDVYALGVMLFYALTGTVPYPGDTALEIFKRQMDVRSGGRAPRPRDTASMVSLGLDALAAEATALDPDKRTSSAAVFLSALRRTRGKLEARSSGGNVPSLATIEDLGPPPSTGPLTPAPPAPRASGLQPSLPSVAPVQPSPAQPAPAGRFLRTLTHKRDPDTGEELAKAGMELVRDVAPYLGPPLLLLVLLLGTAGILRAVANLRRTVPSLAPVVTEKPGPPPALPPMHVGPGQSAPRGEEAYRMGLAHETGDGAEENQRLAAQYYQRAGDHPEALFALGQMYEAGRGVDESESMARSCYQRAAHLGHASAEVRLLALQQQQDWERKAEAEHRRLEADARRREAAEAAARRQREYQEAQERRRQELERQRQERAARTKGG